MIDEGYANAIELTPAQLLTVLFAMLILLLQRLVCHLAQQMLDGSGTGPCSRPTIILLHFCVISGQRVHKQDTHSEALAFSTKSPSQIFFGM